MTPQRRAFLQVHLCVLLWGFTAILGKLITLPALPLVWARMLLVVVALALLPKVWRGLRAMPPRLFWAYAGVGVLVALHWLTFYGAIKLANASVGATCMALATAFTALVEPWLAGTRFSKRDLALGIAVLPGVALVVGGVPDDMRIGIAVGALSALFVAIFGSLNKRLVDHGDPLTVTATPPRHFSGRGLGSDKTLWSGWAMIGAKRRAYYSGDTAMFEAVTLAANQLAPTATSRRLQSTSRRAASSIGLPRLQVPARAFTAAGSQSRKRPVASRQSIFSDRSAVESRGRAFRTCGM